MNADETRAISEPIAARWSSCPEPTRPVVAGDQVVHVFDPTRWIAAESVDVHAHQEEVIPICLKYEGVAELIAFSNDSYRFLDWRRPDWALPGKLYRVRVTAHYEGGREVAEFRVRNAGMSIEDAQVSEWR